MKELTNLILPERRRLVREAYMIVLNALDKKPRITVNRANLEKLDESVKPNAVLTNYMWPKDMTGSYPITDVLMIDDLALDISIVSEGRKVRVKFPWIQSKLGYALTNVGYYNYNNQMYPRPKPTEPQPAAHFYERRTRVTVNAVKSIDALYDAIVLGYVKHLKSKDLSAKRNKQYEEKAAQGVQNVLNGVPCHYQTGEAIPVHNAVQTLLKS